MTVIVEDKPRKPVSEIAREVITLIGVGIKTGATQPLRDAMTLLEPVVKGEYNGRPSAKKRKPKKQGS